MSKHHREQLITNQPTNQTPNLNIYTMDNLTKYFRDTAAELKQVSWPTQHQAMLYTALVIAISVVVSLFVGAFDYGFSEIISLIINNSV